MKVTGSDLMKLLRMITTLSIIHTPTFWVAHDAYLSSRFKLLQVLEKYTLLGARRGCLERSGYLKKRSKQICEDLTIPARLWSPPSQCAETTPQE